MVIIYNCYGGTHSSILSSAVHLGRLPADRIPTKDEIKNLTYFNELRYKDMGRMIFHGVDSEGNKVYTIGRGTSKALIPAMENLVSELHELMHFEEHFAFINTSHTVPIEMTLGGFFSRGLHIDFIGVPLLLAGARRTYPNILRLVDKTKKLCREKQAECLIVEIDGKGRLSIVD